MRLGLNAKLYRSAVGAPTWVEMLNVTDLTLTDEMEEADVTTRGSAGITETEPTLRNLSMEFQMINKVGDADVTAIRGAYTARTPLQFLCLDGINTGSGSTGNSGVRFQGKVFSFTRGQELRGAQTYDVVIKPSADALGVAPNAFAVDFLVS